MFQGGARKFGVKIMESLKHDGREHWPLALAPWLLPVYGRIRARKGLVDAKDRGLSGARRVRERVQTCNTPTHEFLPPGARSGSCLHLVSNAADAIRARFFTGGVAGFCGASLQLSEKLS